LADLIAGTGTGDLAHGGTLSAAAIRRLACDAGLIPLVLGANSEPLDVGTEERFVNRAMRRALNARAKGCVVCGAPPAMCEAHHLVHWANGGPTTVDNLALFCKAHHIDVHHGHWTITMIDGRPVLSRPGWATPTPTRTPSPGRTPSGPPDPWTTNPPDAAPAGSPAPKPRGGSPSPAPETPPGTGPTGPDPWPDDNATAPATASGTGHVIARPPGRSVNPLGDNPHPLGGTARPLDNPILEQLHRQFANHPDPWGDPPAPPQAPADRQPDTPSTNPRPSTTLGR